MVHVRGKSGGTLICKNESGKVNTKPEWILRTGNLCGLASFKRRYIAFLNTNEIQQFFHSSGQKPIEVSDLAADPIVYDTERKTFLTDSLICGGAFVYGNIPQLDTGRENTVFLPGKCL